jgi:hypothetical protein
MSSDHQVERAFLIMHDPKQWCKEALIYKAVFGRGLLKKEVKNKSNVHN